VIEDLKVKLNAKVEEVDKAENKVTEIMNSL